MHRNVILAALSVSLLGVSAPAQAQQDQWTRQITRLLDQAASVATERGLHPTHNPLIGSLRTGASTAHTIQLDGGVAYQLVGVCDNDCSDFDLRLFDARGRMVAEDVLTDDTPVLSVTPRVGGTYTVRAIMTACSDQPCRYGIGVYGGRGGSVATQNDDNDNGGSDQWTGQVNRLLGQAARIAQQNGMHRSHEPYIGALRTSAREEHDIDLSAGTSYQLIGVCDNDCSDLDLRLFDPSGREVASDVLTDDTPVLTVTPRRSGTYRVRAIMTACSDQPCRYGIGVYSGGSGSTASNDGNSNSGGDRWEGQEAGQLRQASSELSSRGMRPMYRPYIGSLRNGANASHAVTLNAGTAYALVGVCDNDCSDLDLRLFDASGREVASDLLTDDTPVVSVTPRRTGTYTVRAIMTQCSSQPCRYGIGVYGR